MPRPRKDATDQRTIHLGMRLTGDEFAEIERRARTADLPPSVYVRHVALTGQAPEAAPPIINHDAFVELVRIGTNVNQMARHVNAGRTNLPALEGLVEEIGLVIDRLLQADGSPRRG